MAPPLGVYLPPLDECFSKNIQLISWKSAFLHLLGRTDRSEEIESLYAFLYSVENIRALSEPFTPFPKPSDTTRADFESRTAAINVASPAFTPYNLDEIKHDALWLSEQVQIDEVVALRIAVLELQARPAEELAQKYSEEEISSLKDAVGIGNLSQSPVSLEDLGIVRYGGSQDLSWSELSSQESRRLKLFQLYLSERLHILKISQHLLGISLHGLLAHHYPTAQATTQVGSERTGGHQTKVIVVAKDIYGAHEDQSQGDKATQRLLDTIDAFRLRLKGLQAGSGFSYCNRPYQDAETIWQTSQIEELAEILKILFLRIQAASAITSSEILLLWLRLMIDYDFLENLNPATDEQGGLIASVQALISVTTLAFLKLPTSSQYLGSASERIEVLEQNDPSLPYFLNPDAVGDINEIFLTITQVGYVTAGPATFAWGVVMFLVREIALSAREDRELLQAQQAVDSFNRNGSPSSPSRTTDQSVFEDILEKSRNPAFDDDFVKVLVSAAVDKCQLFDLIVRVNDQLRFALDVGDMALTYHWVPLEFLGLIRSSIGFLDYIPEVVSALLSILSSPDAGCNNIDDRAFTRGFDPRGVFIHDSFFIDKIFRVAKSRFPYEGLNFLKICRMLASCDIMSDDDGLPFIAQELVSMSTYTQSVSSTFQGYQPIREDENANFVSLINPLTMAEITFSECNMVVSSDELVMSKTLIVPAETVGQVVNESKPPVIMWHHQYNGISFLGKWLQQTTSQRHFGDEMDNEVVPEIIGLLADLIRSAPNDSENKGVESGARRILEMASDALDGSGDIISVILEFFERSLQGFGRMNPGESEALTISCLQFLDSLLRVLPGRVWPFLARSTLLGKGGKAGVLSIIVSAAETNPGDFATILMSVRLFNTVIEDAIAHAAVRRNGGKVSVVSDHYDEWNSAIPSHSMSGCISAFLRVMVDVYSNCSRWKYNDVQQQHEITTSLALSFHRIIYYTYGVDDCEDEESKLLAIFTSSGEHLLNILRPASIDGVLINPVVRSVLDGLYTPSSTANLRLLFQQSRLVRSTLVLAETLAQAGRLVGSPISSLERQLFKASPVLIRLYARHFEYQYPVVTLLELIISYFSTDFTEEPPSLLGHLGSESCRRFLDILSKFDQPFENTSLHVAIWSFISAIISKQQQWLSLFLLTGLSPRDSVAKDQETHKDRIAMSKKPFLEASLDLASSIGDANPRTVIAALNFIAKAQENWPWATPELKKHQHFFSRILKYVASISISSYNPLGQCLVTKIAALVADICGTYLRTAEEARDMSFFKTLIPVISWYSKYGVEVDGYNASLHTNLKRNFEMKYPKCALYNIKRTCLQSPELGNDYFYNLALGTRLFGYEFAWRGTRNQGFLDEVERANMNLSLVETQMALLHSWRNFAIEHCVFFLGDREVQRSMTRVVRHCLTANSRVTFDEHIFSELQQIRAEFAQALLQCLVDANSKGTEVFELLRVAWETTRTRHSTYESALINNDTVYYTSLLNILFLTLQFHVAGPSRTTPEAILKKPSVSSDLRIVVEIIRNVVAQGFRSLTTYLHEEPQRCSPKDFCLLNAISQTALRVKDVERIYEQVAFHLSETEAARYATTLFSWSHYLTLDGDPVYGELSIQFLLEMSCVPLMAQQIAVEAVLMKLSTCQLTKLLRQPQGCGPFDAVPRLFSIWHNGFLPLCLNLLYHVGAAVSEVAAFLNQFDDRLRRAAESFYVSPAAPHPGINPRNGGSSTADRSVGAITLGLAAEACALAVISRIIQKFKDAGPSVGVDPQRIQSLRWDGPQVKDDIESLLEKRSVLRARIVPTNKNETEWFRRRPTGNLSGAESLLEEKIVKELQMAAMCLGAGDVL